MEEKQNTNIMAADLDNVLERNFSFWMDFEKQREFKYKTASKEFFFVAKKLN